MRTVSPRSGPPPLPVSPRLTKKLIHPDHDESLFPVLFGPDGRSVLATSGAKHNVLQIWNADTGEQIRTLQLPKRSIRPRNFIYGGSGTLAPDGRTLYVTFSKERFFPIRKDGKLSSHCETEGEILLWDVTTGQQLPSLKQSPPHSVISVTVSPDGSSLLSLDSVGDDNVWGFRKYSLTRWNTRTGEHQHLLDGRWNPRFAPDGKTFAASFFDVQVISPGSIKSRGKLILCDTASGKERLVFAQTDNGHVGAWNFSPDGRYLAGFQDGDLRATKPAPSEVKLWDVATGKEVGSIVAPEGTTPFRLPGSSGSIGGAFATAVFSPDSRWLAASLHKGRVYLYDVAGRKLAWTKDVKNGFLRMPRFSPDGRWLAVAGQDMPEDLKPRDVVSPFDLPQPRIFLFDMKEGGPPEEIVVPHGQIGGFGFSPDSKTIALGGTGCVWLFDVSRK